MSSKPGSCPDCSAGARQPHANDCDVARCLTTGGQRLSCLMLGASQSHDCGHDTWSGEWPGNAECREFGWYVYGDPSVDGFWVRCGADHPQATEDLNRLVTEADWNPALQRWQQRP